MFDLVNRLTGSAQPSSANPAPGAVAPAAPPGDGTPPPSPPNDAPDDPHGHRPHVHVEPQPGEGWLQRLGWIVVANLVGLLLWGGANRIW
jgi:hypothetical protein